LIFFLDFFKNHLFPLPDPSCPVPMSAADDEVERMTELWRAAHTVHPPAATVSSPDHAGFLQKRGEKAALGLVSRGRRPWARRWFALSRGLLFYFEQPGAGAFKGCLRLNGAVVGTWGGSLVGALFACLFAWLSISCEMA
jgi:hypothetical protein